MAPHPTPNGSPGPGHNFRRTSNQSSPRILHTPPVLTVESSSTVDSPVTCQPHHEYPPRNGQNKQKVRPLANTKWQPGPWSQFSAHVTTKLTSHSSHASAAHCGVLIHRPPPCDLPAPSLVPPSKRRKQTKGAPWILGQHQMAAGPLITTFGACQIKAHLAYLRHLRCSLWSPHPPLAAL